MGLELSPKQLKHHAETLRGFDGAYAKYATAFFRRDQKLAGLRAEVSRQVPAANIALILAGYEPSVYPPPAFAGSSPVLRGLAETAFEIESGSQSRPDGLAQEILNYVRMGAAELERRAVAEEDRRKNPLHWLDMGLRFALAWPAYLFSVLVGSPVWRVQASSFAVPLRLVGLVADAAGIFGLGRTFGWW